MSLNPEIIKDVVIVGAGPAGSVAAYYFARRGLDVWLLDSKAFPRSKPCGDGIGPRAVAALHKLGLGEWLRANDFYRIEKMRLVSGSGSTIVSDTSGYDFPYPYGFVIRRDIFDLKLLEKAVAAGAAWRSGFRVTSCLRQDGRVTGVRGLYQERPVELKARLVVAADGSNGTFSRLFGAKIGTTHALGYRGYLDGLEALDNCANIYFSTNLPKGYGWVFPLSETAANVGVGSLGLKDKNVALKTVFSDFISDTKIPVPLRSGRLVGVGRGAAMRMNFGRRPLFLPGVAFVGDAAGLVSPINGEGIAHALESAAFLTEALAAKFQSAAAVDRGLRDYRRRAIKHYTAYFRWGRFLGRLLANPERLESLIKKARKDKQLAHVLTGVLSNTIHPRELGRWRIVKRLL